MPWLALHYIHPPIVRITFPYAGQVLDALIRGKRTFESKLFLGRAIEHNKKVQRKLQKLVDKSKTSCKGLYSATPNNNYYDDDDF